jgi:DNA repair protein RadC
MNEELIAPAGSASRSPARHRPLNERAPAGRRPHGAGKPEPLPKPIVISEDEVIIGALRILRGRLKERDVFATPDAVKDYLRLQAQGLTYEVFSLMYLDAQNALIEYERLFRGTLTQTSVYPREVVKQALAHNAASIVLHHNHPSGFCQPSRADEALTQTLKSSLALVDIRVLDHIITSDRGALSMAERGML